MTHYERLKRKRLSDLILDENLVSKEALLAALQERLAEWRTQTNDPLLNPENLKRLKAEVDACIINGEAHKNRLELSYPDYFFQRRHGEPVGAGTF